MKTIEDAVIEFGGKWPSLACDHMREFVSKNVWLCDNHRSRYTIFSKSEFEVCARRLGFIYGYRWGVEYPTNGKRPDLADDVVVQLTLNSFTINHEEVETANWSGSFKFKITDPRYKPADTSYLNAPSQDDSLTHSEWWDYDKMQVKSGKLIPAGSEVLFFDRAPNPFKCKVMYSSEYVTVIRCIDGSVNKGMIGVDISRCPFEENFNQIKPVDWNIKAELHREKVIEAAMKFCYDKNSVEEMIESIYSAGMLVLPQDSSNTKD